MGTILLCGEIIIFLEFVSLPLVKSENLAQSENAAFYLGLWGYRRHLYVGLKGWHLEKQMEIKNKIKAREMEIHSLYSKNCQWIGLVKCFISTGKLLKR